MWDFRFFKILKNNEKMRKLKFNYKNRPKTPIFDRN